MAKFKYKRRNADTVKKRMNQSGNTRESFIDEAVDMYKVKDGDNLLRPLPPTFNNLDGSEPTHYGMDVFVHYDVGSDQSSFLCLEQNYGKPCPICMARQEAEAEGDKDLADSLKPRKRVLVYVIDRDNEDAGPLVWSAPWTVDKDISMRSFDKRPGVVFYPDDPEEGYDIEFAREGKGRNTKYVGVQLARRSSPLADDDDLMDEWLEKISDNPLDSILIEPDAEHMERVFNAGMGVAKADEEEDEKPSRSRRSRRRDDDDEDEKPARSRRRSRRDEEEEEEEEKPRSRRRSRRDEEEEEEEEKPKRSRRSRKAEKAEEPEEPEEAEEAEEEGEEEESGTDVKSVEDLEYDDVTAMDRDDLEGLIDEAGLDIPDADDLEDDELAAEICAELGLKKPRRRNSAVRERLSSMRDAG